MTDAPEAGRSHILLVDDEPVLLTILSRMLRDAGYVVDTAATAEDALVFLDHRLQADLVVTDAMIGAESAPMEGMPMVVSDVRLPRMNGCALGRVIVQRWPGVRLLFISGYVAEDLIAKRICPGNLPLLPKPFMAEDLLEAVRDTLANAPWVPSEWPDGTAGEWGDLKGRRV